ncbi:MAG TPA: response regulator [Rhizomicrobium sp.]|nr:response regulator [Rhizomicrobium sp.]
MPTKNAKASTPGGDTGQTVIVAESDIFARMVLAQFLRECGYEVLEAATSEDVLAVLRSGREIDVLLLDAQISGGLAGFTLTRLVREQFPGTEIVLTFGVAKSAEKAGEICDKGPRERPYHPQEIVTRIKRLRQNRAQKP